MDDCYINPSKMSKEKWLDKNGALVKNYPICDSSTIFPDFNELSSSKDIVVVFVDYGFKVAVVAYNSDVYNRYTQSEDLRPRKIYTVRKSLLLDENVIGMRGINLLRCFGVKK